MTTQDNSTVQPRHSIGGMADLLANAEYVERERTRRRAQIVSISDIVVFLLLSVFSRAPYLCLVAPYPILTIIGLRKQRPSYLRCCVGYHLASVFLRLTLMVLSRHNTGLILWGCFSLLLNGAGLYYNYVLARQMIQQQSTVEMINTYP